MPARSAQRRKPQALRKAGASRKASGSRQGSTARKPQNRPRGSLARRRRLWKLWRLWPSQRLRRRTWRLLRRAPRLIQITVCILALAAVALAVNGVYQVLRKPTELFFPVSGTLAKTPAQTWRDYGSLFRRYSTGRLSPEFLAALAQVEGSGNPIARTYWRWSWKPHFFELYRPASSAVGMYQITDGTFAEARRYCIHDHAVLDGEPGAGAASPCWLEGLYFRVIPSNAVELTAAYLDRHVALALERAGLRTVRPRQAERLAAVIHLCGAGAGEAFARRGLRFRAGERCGDHDPSVYVARVEAMRAEFVRLAARG
jgi:hypothetical protein